jgi:hypothetical protein
MPDEQDQVADALDDLRNNGSRPQRGPDDDDSNEEVAAGG